MIKYMYRMPDVIKVDCFIGLLAKCEAHKHHKHHDHQFKAFVPYLLPSKPIGICLETLNNTIVGKKN